MKKNTTNKKSRNYGWILKNMSIK